MRSSTNRWAVLANDDHLYGTLADEDEVDRTLFGPYSGEPGDDE